MTCSVPATLRSQALAPGFHQAGALGDFIADRAVSSDSKKRQARRSGPYQHPDRQNEWHHSPDLERGQESGQHPAASGGAGSLQPVPTGRAGRGPEMISTVPSNNVGRQTNTPERRSGTVQTEQTEQTGKQIAGTGPAVNQDARRAVRLPDPGHVSS